MKGILLAVTTAQILFSASALHAQMEPELESQVHLTDRVGNRFDIPATDSAYLVRGYTLNKVPTTGLGNDAGLLVALPDDAIIMDLERASDGTLYAALMQNATLDAVFPVYPRLARITSNGIEVLTEIDSTENTEQLSSYNELQVAPTDDGRVVMVRRQTSGSTSELITAWVFDESSDEYEFTTQETYTPGQPIEEEIRDLKISGSTAILQGLSSEYVSIDFDNQVLARQSALAGFTQWLNVDGAVFQTDFSDANGAGELVDLAGEVSFTIPEQFTTTNPETGATESLRLVGSNSDVVLGYSDNSSRDSLFVWDLITGTVEGFPWYPAPQQEIKDVRITDGEVSLTLVTAYQAKDLKGYVPDSFVPPYHTRASFVLRGPDFASLYDPLIIDEPVPNVNITNATFAEGNGGVWTQEFEYTLAPQPEEAFGLVVGVKSSPESDGATFLLPPITLLNGLNSIKTERTTRSDTLTIITNILHADFRPLADYAAGETLSFNSTVSIAELPRLAASIFPNPADNYLQVQLEEPTSEILAWTVVDALGRSQIFTPTNGNGQTLRFDVTELPAGTYTLIGQREDAAVVEQFSKVK